ncbi:MAG: PIG-L deacetylase family protein [Actinomycetota bacterium]
MPTTGPEDLGSILGVWAHPDDEAYLSGGLMAAAAQAGRPAAMVTATLGEAGTPDPAAWPPWRLRRVRHWELRASMAVLGVEDHRLLGYADGTLADVESSEGAARVAEVIEDVSPDTILTFGPEGMTGHSDHKAVSTWSTRGWEEAGRPGRLLYATQPVGYAERMKDLDERFSIFFAGRPPETPVEEMAVRFELPPELVDRKVVALRAQASQTAPIIQDLGVEAFGMWVSTEHFVEAE